MRHGVPKFFVLTDAACPTLWGNFVIARCNLRQQALNKKLRPIAHSFTTLYLYRFKDCKLTAHCCVKDMQFNTVRIFIAVKLRCWCRQPQARTRELAASHVSLRLSSLKLSNMCWLFDKIIPYFFAVNLRCCLCQPWERTWNLQLPCFAAFIFYEIKHRCLTFRWKCVIISFTAEVT